MSAVLMRPTSIASRGQERPEPDLLAEASALALALDERPSSAGFAALLGAYRSSGGTARGEDLARLLTDHHQGDYVSLARLLVAGDVFGFVWRQTVWIPMFQFGARDLSFRQALRPVLAELAPHFDGWALAAWFANANPRLGGHRPVDLLDRELPAVLAAARAARLSAAGCVDRVGRTQ